MQFIVKLEHKDFYKNEDVFKALYDLGAAVTPPKETSPGQPTKEKVSDISDVNLNKVSAEKKPEAPPAVNMEDEPETDIVTYTVEQVRRAFGDLSKSKGKEAAKGILSEMGYAKVTEIPSDRYADAMERIQEVS